MIAVELCGGLCCTELGKLRKADELGWGDARRWGANSESEIGVWETDPALNEMPF